LENQNAEVIKKQISASKPFETGYGYRSRACIEWSF